MGKMTLRELLESIEKHPGMYLVKHDLMLLDAYLSGFLFCKESIGILEPNERAFRYYFSRYVAMKLDYDEGERWSKYLSNKDQGWHLFFEYAYCFLREDYRLFQNGQDQTSIN
jgi:hypothetical protein